MRLVNSQFELPHQLLIADDDRDFRESLAEGLRRRGFQSILASDGQEAVDMLQNCSVQLILVDMHMPRLSGLETLAVLKELQIDIPAILMSAQLDADIVDRAEKFSIASIFSKPFSIRSIAATIQQVLQSRSHD